MLGSVMLAKSAAITLIVLLAPACAGDTVGYTIAPLAKIKANERITSFTITLRQGVFVTFDGIPDGWIFEIYNGAHGETKIVGDISVGAAALYRKELPATRICVRPEPYGGEPFAISGALNVTSDFEKVHLIRLSAKDFQPVKCALR